MPSLNDLVCVGWSGELLPAVPDAASGPHTLRCVGCQASYSIIDRVPHFAERLDNQGATASSFGFAWRAFWEGRFDENRCLG